MFLICLLVGVVAATLAAVQSRDTDSQVHVSTGAGGYELPTAVPKEFDFSAWSLTHEVVGETVLKAMELKNGVRYRAYVKSEEEWKTVVTGVNHEPPAPKPGDVEQYQGGLHEKYEDGQLKRSEPLQGTLPPFEPMDIFWYRAFATDLEQGFWNPVGNGACGSTTCTVYVGEYLEFYEEEGMASETLPRKPDGTARIEIKLFMDPWGYLRRIEGRQEDMVISKLVVHCYSPGTVDVCSANATQSAALEGGGSAAFTMSSSPGGTLLNLVPDSPDGLVSEPVQSVEGVFGPGPEAGMSFNGGKAKAEGLPLDEGDWSLMFWMDPQCGVSGGLCDQPSLGPLNDLRPIVILGGGGPGTKGLALQYRLSTKSLVACVFTAGPLQLCEGDELAAVQSGWRQYAIVYDEQGGQLVVHVDGVVTARIPVASMPTGFSFLDIASDGATTTKGFSLDEVYLYGAALHEYDVRLSRELALGQAMINR